MNGTIRHAHVKYASQRQPGGMILVDGILDRIPFVESELVGIRLADCLDQTVMFDLDGNGHAVRVRPAMGVTTKKELPQ